MDCPKCKAEMEFGTLEGLRVDRCLQCRGIWFREDHHRKLRKAKDAHLIDIGSPELGRQFDEAAYVPCPDCGQAMDRTSDSSQPHIFYEKCADGHGVFFDAGEYKDYKDKSIGDLFKRIAAPFSN